MTNNITPHRVYIAVGSNDNPFKHIQQGLSQLAEHADIIAVSAFYEGEAIGDTAPAYWNGAIAIQWTQDANRLKPTLRGIEDASGRIRRLPDGRKSSLVTLDLDILLGDGFPPHPDILTRDYVAIPLAQIAPELPHPTTQQTIDDIAKGFVKGSRLIQRPETLFFNKS